MKPFIWIPVVMAIGLAAWVAQGGNRPASDAPLRAHPPGFPLYSKAGYDITPLTKERIAEIVKTLTPEQASVTQEADTERPFCNGMYKNHGPGTYVSVVGGLPLFKAKTKFDSGTGWPSFYEPVSPDHIIERADNSFGGMRTEVRDARSGAHLGHVFDDGPPPTNKRYCINAAALKFIPEGTPLPPESRPVASQVAYFAGGCFWGVEDVFEQIPGVMDAESGYQGGKTVNPTYEEVSSHTTGHAETVKVTFDPSRVTYRELLKVFFDNHDPTTVDRHGPDVGSNYRSAIFASTPEQQKEANAYIAQLAHDPLYQGEKIVTQVVSPAPPFYRAEEYHQNWHAIHGGSCKVKLSRTSASR
jgi:peptide methionine sulfoxide reductase msrA/msrB